MESNNTILNNENFLNTFQHFPNNLAMEFNSMISLNNTHTNNTDYNINNNHNYSETNHLDNFSDHTNTHHRSNINSIQQIEQINCSTLTLSQNMNLSLDNNKNKEEEEEEEPGEECEENEENIILW